MILLSTTHKAKKDTVRIKMKFSKTDSDTESKASADANFSKIKKASRYLTLGLKIISDELIFLCHLVKLTASR